MFIFLFCSAYGFIIKEASELVRSLKYSSSVAGIIGSRCCSLHERTS